MIRSTHATVAAALCVVLFAAACDTGTPGASAGFAIGRAAAGPFDQAHTQWGLALDAYTDDNGVRYDAIHADPRLLDRYLSSVAAVDSSEFGAWDEADQIAYLINAYNALAIRTVAAHYPIERSMRPTALMRPSNSVWQIDGFFDEIRHTVAGRRLTLDDIHHSWLRRRYDDPRVHFALACPASSCPPLRSEPFRGEILYNQLADQVRRYVNSPANQFDREEDVVQLSAMFDWFSEDFADLAPEEGFRGNEAQRGALALVSRHLPDSLATWLEQGYYRVRYLDYDWSLNQGG